MSDVYLFHVIKKNVIRLSKIGSKITRFVNYTFRSSFQFTSDVFSKICKRNDIKKIYVLFYNPKRNSIVERVNPKITRVLITSEKTGIAELDEEKRFIAENAEPKYNVSLRDLNIE